MSDWRERLTAYLHQRLPSADSLELANQPHRELKSRRLSFEIPWTRLHNIRTAANLTSLLLTIASLVIKIQ